jgi:Iron only nitrogenase protein AnfO (AnfO_nitrog).
MRIAIYTDTGGGLVPYTEACKITVYEEMGSWIIVGEYPLQPLSLNSSAGITTSVRIAAECAAKMLDGCKIIVGAELSGIPFHVFDRCGFLIYQLTEIDGFVMDAVAFEAGLIFEKSACESKSTDTVPASAQVLPICDFPAETVTPGVYYFNLITAQKRDPSMTSKKALARFLKEIAFEELVLVCAHIPPWLENGMLEIDTSVNRDGTLTVSIKPKFASTGSCFDQCGKVI